jgi:hypothetical protein
MNIRTAIVSSVAVSFLWLSPLIADAKDKKETTAPTPMTHSQCVSNCEAAWNKCRNATLPKPDGNDLRACDVKRMDCRNILCAPSTPAPPK